MAGDATQPRDLRPQPEADAPVRREDTDHPVESGPGRWEREAEAPHESGPEDSATKSSRIYFFILAAIIAAAIAVFLILHPQAGD